MGKYLLVAHQTAEASELLDAALALAAEESEADFTLLVPATPVGDLLTWHEGEAKQVARQRAESASAALRRNGLNVVEVKVGDADPVLAIGDEFVEGRRYDAVIISTLAPGVSRWIKMDAVSRVRRQHPNLRLIHVVPKEP
jgi:hypothetical protein